MQWVLAAVAVLGVSASAPLMAYAAAPAMAIGFWRNALGTAALLPLGRRTIRAELGSLPRRELAAIGFAGAMLAVHFGTWIASLQLTSVAAATAMVSMQLVFVVAIDRMRGVRAPRQVLIGMAVAVAGVLVVTGVDFGTSVRALTGDLLALLGGLAAALYLIAGARVRASISTTSYAIACYGVCAVLLGVGCLVTGAELTGYASSTWIAIVAVTVCAQLLGHTILNHLLATMSPGVISLLLLLEVPGAAILAGVFLDQRPPFGVFVGLGLILAGLAVVTRRRPVPEAPPT